MVVLVTRNDGNTEDNTNDKALNFMISVIEPCLHSLRKWVAAL